MNIHILVAHSNQEVRKQISEALVGLATASPGLSIIQTQVSDAADARGNLVTTAFDAIVIDALLPTRPGAGITSDDYGGLEAFLNKQTVVPPTVIMTDVDPDARLRAIAQRICRSQFLLPDDDIKQALAKLIGPARRGINARLKRLKPSAKIVLHFSLSNPRCEIEYAGGPFVAPFRRSKSLAIQRPNDFQKLLGRVRGFQPAGLKQWSSEIENRGSQLFTCLRELGLDEYYDAALRHCEFRLERLQIHFQVDPELDDVPLEHLVDYELSQPYFLMLRSPMTRSLNATESHPGSGNARLSRPPRILCVLSDVEKESLAHIEGGAFPDIDWQEFNPLPGLDKERDFFNKLKSSIPNVRILPSDAERGLPLRDLLDREIGDAAKRKPRYDIVHFAGHGYTQLLEDGRKSRTFLILGRPGSFYDPLPIEIFVDWLRECGTQLIYLGACSTASSSTAYAIAREGIPAVIGFRWRISDVAAPHLMQNFYERLNRSRDVPVPEALRHAVGRMYVSGFDADPIWAAPVLVVPRQAEQRALSAQEVLQ
jgi:CHAT domain-containing protein